MSLPINDAPGIVAFTNNAGKLLADLMFGRIENQAEAVNRVREEGAQVSAKTANLPVKAYIRRTIADLEYYQSVPYQKHASREH